MAIIDDCELMIVMEEGSDIRVLARLEHLELAISTFMAAKFKFPKENLVLRREAQVIRRHDGAPRPPPPSEVSDPDLLDWDVNLVRGKKNDFKGTVMAKDHKSAIAAAIEHFRLNDWQVKRLMVTVRTRPVYRP